ncbi:MAG: pyruvate kinase [Steroidobacteraceae bacterium]|nr:pyruvate kinase [Nevskiaceae bacterium]MCP5466280.1 pyruvate kinase [Nevskiaceae bacterium]MCP5471682.1 pyruvate kinase [Nevskiaceae bacterium]
MLRRTKIVATLGPATDDVEILRGMCRAGLDVARLNFSHGTHEQHRRRLAMLREACRLEGRVVGLLGDLAGPKIRIESFRDGPVQLVEGQAFALDTSLDPQAGNAEAVGCAYQNLPADVGPGDTLLLNDGLIVLEVTGIRGTRIDTRVVSGGELSNRKGVNRKGGGISAPALTDKDFEDIRFAAAEQLDYVALSFVRDAADIRQARKLLDQAGSSARIVAKVERQEAIQHLSGIVDVADVVMVARGDLGVEMGYAALTGLQKTIIQQTRNRNRLVITATQMMESMVQNPVPTRAEVSDVANAVMDGSDAVMLSAETASGRYPVKAVAAMAEVIEGAEGYQLSQQRVRHRAEGSFSGTEQAIANAVMYTANHMKVRAIVALTESGSTPLWMSRIRSDIPIYAFTRHEATRRRVTLYRGVYPVDFDVSPTALVTMTGAIFAQLLKLGLVDEGDLVILTKGELTGVAGGTNSMQILPVRRF